MKKYFNIKLERPETYGCAIEVDTNDDLEHRLSDFSGSNYEERNTFRLTGQSKTKATYEMTIPEEEFSAGGCVPSLSIAAGPGYVKKGEDKANLTLTNKGVIKAAKRTKAGKKIFVKEITRQEAENLKDAAAKWFLYQCYIAGF